MSETLPQIAKRHAITAADFRELVRAGEGPVLLRGLVRDWPAVQGGLAGAPAMAAYLDGFDRGGEVDVLQADAKERGRIFYDASGAGFNFTRTKASVRSVNASLLAGAGDASPPMVVAQSALLADCLPGFADANRLPILAPSIAPRLWLGNRVVTPAHFDESHNVACVVAGRRRFTLFPPGQVANLYIGPLGHAPTGTPISLVDFAAPDFARFPRFRDALAAARVADLEPGDALFIPTLWWHHVQSLSPYNVLVNYWWKGAPGAPAPADSALDALLHALLALEHVPPEQREAWGAIFGHFVFHAEGDPAAHIEPAVRGVLGKMPPAMGQQLRAYLAGKLQAQYKAREGR